MAAIHKMTERKQLFVLAKTERNEMRRKFGEEEDKDREQKSLTR